MTICPTHYGRRNKKGGAVEMMKWQRDNAIPVAQARKSRPEELVGKIVYGELWRCERPEYTRQYRYQRPAEYGIERGTRVSAEETEVKQKQKRYEMCFTGSGGQGVILCSTILAEAAFLAGKMVAQSQSYGPQARGGLCRAELIIDEERIIYPKVTSAGFLLALTQASLDRLRIGMAEDALIVIDTSLPEPDNLGSGNVVRFRFCRLLRRQSER